jgi:Mn-dependent DtxR family transcriptional regulator
MAAVAMETAKMLKKMKNTKMIKTEQTHYVSKTSFGGHKYS